MTVHPKCRLQQRGVTLVELIMSMVIIAIALTGIFSVMNFTIGHSADPIVQYQAVGVAESYLEEILSRAYTDPDGSESGESRPDFDDVDDYDGLSNTGARDQQDVVIAPLSQYGVTVAVAAPVVLTGNVNAKKITVTVTGPAGSGLELVGYKADY